LAITITTNYNAASGSVLITIAKANATIVVTGYSGVYDTFAHGATGTAKGVKGEYLSILLNVGASFTDVPGGTANWSFAGNGNYNNAAGTAAINISKADQTITFGALGNKYVVEPAFAVNATASSGLLVSFSIASGPASIFGNIVTLTGTGVVTVHASQAGNGNYNPAFPEIDQSFTVKSLPVVTIGVLNPVSPINSTVTFSATPSDLSYTSVQWTLCSLGNPEVTLPPTTVSGTFVFPSVGVYTLKVKLTYPGVNVVAYATYQYIVIYDPNGSFVTGGGWINSPAGAYPQNPLLTGKANFGFVSKYKKGATVPDGNTEFQFQAGNLNFNSTSYEWLVVSGAKAQFKGVGTINGAGSYNFILSAIDGQVAGGGGTDKFRIKITNGSTVVYDNQIATLDDLADPTTVIGGGSIVLHK
jgi:hypothetical protein